MKNKIVVITGVSSHLGRNVKNILLKNGYYVIGILRKKADTKYDIVNEANYFSLNLDYENFDNDEISRAANEILNIKNEICNKNKECDIEIVFIHFAWNKTSNANERHDFASQMLNVDMSNKIYQIARNVDATTFIFAGSQAEYGDTAYGMAKNEFANICIENGDKKIKFIHLRIFSVYGKEESGKTLLKQLVCAIKNEEDIDLTSCKFKWNYLFIDDFCKIVKKIIENDISSGVYDIAGRETKRLMTFVKQTAKVFDSNIKLNFGKRAEPTETFAIPNIDMILSQIGNIKFKSFRKGIETYK